MKKKKKSNKINKGQIKFNVTNKKSIVKYSPKPNVDKVCPSYQLPKVNKSRADLSIEMIDEMLIKTGLDKSKPVNKCDSIVTIKMVF